MESFRLETIGELHPVAAQVFVPFAVTRLQERPEDTEAVLTVVLRGIEQQTAEERPLRLFWERSSIPVLPPAIGDAPLTEWAALAVACAVIWHFAGLRLHAVAAVGDRVDYWVRRDNLDFGLEISGTRRGRPGNSPPGKDAAAAGQPLWRGRVRGRREFCRSTSHLFLASP